MFKYAFPTGFNERRPTLWVALTVQAEQVCLLVRDNGVGLAGGGLAGGGKSARSSSLGMGIVNALAGQLGGGVVIRDAFAPVPADMPQLDPPAALDDSPGSIAQVCVPQRRAADKK